MLLICWTIPEKLEFSWLGLGNVGPERWASNTRNWGLTPLDICVLNKRPINRSDIILSAVVIGGVQMVDQGEANEKIVAVLKDDYL